MTLLASMWPVWPSAREGALLVHPCGATEWSGRGVALACEERLDRLQRACLLYTSDAADDM
eukprot:12074530-Alexandrium_andersonii.AAC.1